ncbi:MAG TPA: LacI family DNA-binding transcriptional regulator [Glycomyces sp.]|nr:LacI family DNA-binding transcriptional regulator [Glycomyces sp.]
MARLAGVSPAAVSKVIRGAYGVSPAMRERVDAAIAQLDYRPRVAARAMRGSTFSIGIELPHPGYHFFTTILQGATAALEDTRYRAIVVPTATDAERDGRALDMLADYQVDGIVAVSPLVAPDRLERLAARTPVVLLGRHDRTAAYDTVTGDDVAGTRLVMEHLLGLGHRRIAYLVQEGQAAMPGVGTPQEVRMEQYRERMRRAGLGGAARVVRTADGDHVPEDAVEALLAPERPTAVLVGRHELALGLLQALAERGLSSADVAVAGYDDTALAGHPAIGLTCVDQDGAAIGREAIGLLLERIGGRTEAAHRSVEPTLKVRASTVPGR